VIKNPGNKSGKKICEKIREKIREKNTRKNVKKREKTVKKSVNFFSFAAAWRSGRRFYPEEQKIRVRIPPGCEVSYGKHSKAVVLIDMK
jgi:hypothetical protein